MKSFKYYILEQAENIIDVGTEGYPAENLSNFTAHEFTIDGVPCASMEGFLQGIKFRDPEKQKRICAKVGIKAKGKGKKSKWYLDQLLHWQGKEIDRHGPEYQKLLDKAFNELNKNKEFQKALEDTGNKKLDHSIGKTDPNRTVLTKNEFISRLNNLRKKNENV